jgi:hypothetical protein
LLSQTWQDYRNGFGPHQYKATGYEKYLTPRDLQIKWQFDYQAVAQQYAANNTAFLANFASGWTKLMNADMFNGPRNGCISLSPSPVSAASSGLTPGAAAAITFFVTVIILGILFGVYLYRSKSRGHSGVN